MATIKIDSEVLLAYNSVNDRVSQISMVIKQGMCYFYSEYQEISYYAKCPIDATCELSTTLNIEIMNSIMQIGTLQVSVLQSDKNVYRFVLVDSTTERIIYGINTILQVCLHEKRIKELSSIEIKQVKTLRDSQNFVKACALTKVNDKSLNQKGMIFDNGYAWTMGNGYLIYLEDKNNLNFIASVSTLRALLALRGRNLSFFSDGGYNYCMQDNSILGWRKERRSSKLPLDYLQYECEVKANFNRVCQVLDSIKSTIEDVVLSLKHGTVTIYSLLGVYIVPIETEPQNVADFHLSPVILHSILKDCKDKPVLKYSKSRVEIECNGVHYIMSEVQK